MKQNRLLSFNIVFATPRVQFNNMTPGCTSFDIHLAIVAISNTITSAYWLVFLGTNTRAH